MLAINRKKICYPLILVLMIALLPVFSSAHVYPENTSEKWIKKVKLKKNAKINGFKIKIKTGVPYFEALNVTDPKTKKLVEGEQQLEYRCKESNQVKTITLTFIGGNSASIQISCTDLIEPQIIVMDEEESSLPDQ